MKSIIRRNMRERNETQFRHEQFILQKYFEVYAPNLDIRLEHPVCFVKEGDWLQTRVCIIDLADLTNKIAWRLNGEIHTGLRKERDEEQKYYLEEIGWTVIDCYKDSWNWAWLWKEKS